MSEQRDCDVCAGEGRLLTGAVCICEGTGRAAVAIDAIREELCRVTALIEEYVRCKAEMPVTTEEAERRIACEEALFRRLKEVANV